MTLKEQIIQLRNKGLSNNQIAETMGRTRGSLNYLIHKYKIGRTNRGQGSYVIRNKTAGGTLVIRIPKKLHKQLADHCESIDQSINKFVTNLIQQTIDS